MSSLWIHGCRSQELWKRDGDAREMLWIIGSGRHLQVFPDRKVAHLKSTMKLHKVGMNLFFKAVWCWCFCCWCPIILNSRDDSSMADCFWWTTWLRQQLAEAYHKNKPLCFNASSFQKTHPATWHDISDPNGQPHHVGLLINYWPPMISQTHGIKKIRKNMTFQKHRQTGLRTTYPTYGIGLPWGKGPKRPQRCWCMLDSSLSSGCSRWCLPNRGPWLAECSRWCVDAVWVWIIADSIDSW